MEGNIKAPVGEGPVLYLYGGSLLAAALLQLRSDGPTNTFWAWTAVFPNTCTQKTGSNELCPTITLYRTGQDGTEQDKKRDRKQDRTGQDTSCSVLPLV